MAVDDNELVEQSQCGGGGIALLQTQTHRYRHAETGLVVYGHGIKEKVVDYSFLERSTGIVV